MTETGEVPWHGAGERQQGLETSDTTMRLFKDDFYRFLAFGFGAGALLVLATIGIGGSSGMNGGVVPSAVAASTR